VCSNLYQMKRFSLTLLVICIFLFSADAQNGRSIPAIDKSPMDISYYPANYPVQKIQDRVTEPLLARILYSRPQKNGRKVFGELIEFGTVWRLGANEATELDLFKDAKLGKVKIKKGRYTLFAIPSQDKWTFIVNSDTDTWGAFKYDAAKDLARMDIKVELQSEPVEHFTMIFEKGNAQTINLVILWDNYKAVVPFVF
jgi:hypothetical protein